MGKISYGKVMNDLSLGNQVVGVAGDRVSTLKILHYLGKTKKQYVLVLENYDISDKPIILHKTEDRSVAEISQIASIFIALVRQ